jgi:hypothetical protein
MPSHARPIHDDVHVFAFESNSTATVYVTVVLLSYYSTFTYITYENVHPGKTRTSLD